MGKKYVLFCLTSIMVLCMIMPVSQQTVSYDTKNVFIKDLKENADINNDNLVCPCQSEEHNGIEGLFWAIFDGPCDVMKIGIFYHPLTIIDSDSPFEAHFRGLTGSWDVYCPYGGTIFMLNAWGNFQGLNPGYDPDGGSLACWVFYVSVTCN